MFMYFFIISAILLPIAYLKSLWGKIVKVKKSKTVYDQVILSFVAIMFLITDSESSHKITSIAKFLWSMSIFMESCAPNHDFDQNLIFAVREQLHRLRTEPTPDLDLPWSRVPPTIWNLVFLIVCAPLPLCFS